MKKRNKEGTYSNYAQYYFSSEILQVENNSFVFARDGDFRVLN